MKKIYHHIRRASQKRHFWWIVIPALVLVTALYSLFFLQNPAENKSLPGAPKETMLVVPPNASMKDVADSLKNLGIIRSEITFRAAAKMIRAGHQLHGGTFQIHRGLTNLQLLQDLVGTKYQVIF